MATRLYRALVQTRRITRLPNFGEWTSEFDKLLKAVNAARVLRVLDWYCSNHTQAYMPQAFSAEQFRKKFESIEAKMVAAVERVSVAPVTPDVLKLANRLTSRQDWPVEVLPRLPSLISEGKRNLANFVLAVTNLRDSLPTGGRGRAFLTRVLDEHLHPGFVEDDWLPWWYETRMSGGRRAVPVDLLLFDPRSEDFINSFWHDWSAKWCGDWSRYDPVLQQLNAA